MKMKKRCQRGFVLLLGCLMLSGCGMQEAPYELTEEEQQLIVSYSAHVVSKFNTYQKDGLIFVPEIEEEEPEIPSETVSESEQQEVLSEINVSGNSGGEASSEEPAAQTTFDSVYAETGLTFTYLGNEVTASYMQDSTYAVNAGYGKKLLVVKLNVENLTEEAVTIDNLTSGDTFSANYVMDSGSKYNAKSVLTLLLNDFTTFEGTIEPQSAVEMVMVFEVPAETEAVEGISLKVNRNGKNFQINL